jgi:C1A family cysteine protease
VGFSCAHELIAKPKPVKGITAKFAREQVYWEAQKLDDWEGGSYPGASPKYEGTSTLCGVKALQKLGYIKEYRWSFSLEDLILAVGHIGPAILGLNWYEGMFEPHSCGYLHVTGKLSGGHAILCRGVNVKEGYFLLHNSWGKDWGDNGTAKVSFEEMRRLLKEEGEAVVPLVRSLVL